MMNDLEKYLSVPYRKGGRDESGCDCWGLARLVLERERGILLPSYDGAAESDAEGIESRFRRLSGPEDWCLVLMARGVQAHVAVWINGWILHMTRNGAVFQPEGRARDIRGYYAAGQDC